LIQTGTRDPQGKGMKRSTLGITRSKVMVTRGQNRSQSSLQQDISRTIRRIVTKPGIHILW